MLLIIAPSYAIAERFAAGRQWPGEWHWFTSQAAADRWLLRCQERGIVVDPEWIVYEDDDPRRKPLPPEPKPRKQRRPPNRLMPSKIDLLRGEG